MLESKKILVLNTSGKISGAERSLIDVLKVLTPQFIPILVLPAKDDLFRILESSVHLEVVDLLRFKKGLGFWSNPKVVLKVIKHIYEIAKIHKKYKIDVIYTNTQAAQLYAIVLNLYLRKKIVWHVRDNIHSRALSFIFSFFSHRIICISSHIYRQIYFKNKAELLYNGIDIDFWKPISKNGNKIKSLLRLDKGTLLVAHVGQLIPWKRHELFVDVARKILSNSDQKIHFVIIGNDLFEEYADYKKSLVESIVLSNLSHKISIIEYLNNFIEYLPGVDIVLHLAHEEPFGRVIIEAMALEKPVIAIDEGGPSEIIKNNVSGFLIPQADPALIVHKLRILLSNSQLRSEFGRKGRKIVESAFNIQNLHRINKIFAE